MPSKKKQYNIRLSDAQAAEVERLRGVIEAATGGLSISVTDVFVVAINELSKKHPKGKVK